MPGAADIGTAQKRPHLVLRRRLSTESSVPDAMAAWLVHLGAAKPSPATITGYERDVSGIAARLAVLEGHVEATPDGLPPDGASAQVALGDLHRQALVAAFA